MTAAVVVAALAGAAVAASAVTSGSGAHPALTPTPRPAAAAPCTLSELRVHRLQSYAGLGQSGAYYGLTNTGGQRCSLQGWPYVVAIKADGTRATGALTRETFYGPFKAPPHPPRIDLKPGATAAFALTTSDSRLDGGPCPAPYTRLRIGLAKGSATTTLSAWIPYLGQYFQACQGFVVSELVPKSDLRG